MITLKPTARRLLLLAPILSLLAAIYSCQPQESVFVTTPESEPREMAAYECDPTKEGDPAKEVATEDDATQDECDAAMAEALTKSNDCTLNPRLYCFESIMVGSVPKPTPCPSGHCIPFLMIPRVCFYSEDDKRPVEIFVNNKLVGTATDVSYDAKKKLRTVSFDLEKNFKKTEGQAENVMSVKIPVTYPVLSAEGKRTGETMQTVLDIATNF